MCVLLIFLSGCASTENGQENGQEYEYTSDGMAYKEWSLEFATALIIKECLAGPSSVNRDIVFNDMSDEDRKEYDLLITTIPDKANKMFVDRQSGIYEGMNLMAGKYYQQGDIFLHKSSIYELRYDVEDLGYPITFSNTLSIRDNIRDNIRDKKTDDFDTNHINSFARIYNKRSFRHDRHDYIVNYKPNYGSLEFVSETIPSENLKNFGYSTYFLKMPNDFAYMMKKTEQTFEVFAYYKVKVNECESPFDNVQVDLIRIDIVTSKSKENVFQWRLE